MRRIDEINDDIIKTIREKNEIVNSGGESSLVAAYEQKISDLETERDRADQFDRQLQQNMQSLVQLQSANDNNTDDN